MFPTGIRSQVVVPADEETEYVLDITDYSFHVGGNFTIWHVIRDCPAALKYIQEAPAGQLPEFPRKLSWQCSRDEATPARGGIDRMQSGQNGVSSIP
jgi:hypothetical protein